MNPSSPSGTVVRAHARHNGDILMPGVAACPAGAPTQPVRLTANLQPVAGVSGSGTAAITIRMGLRQLCYTLTVTGLNSDVTDAHIHRVAGDAIVVPLSAPTTGTATGCVTVERTLLQEIVRNPAAFYVNVHTTAKPGGHVQGTLAR
jgi:hypothetical protein